MLFNSITFLLFHCLFLALYWASGSQRIRQILLLVSSLVFYGWHYWPGLFILVAAIVVNYWLGIWIEESGRDKRVLTFAVVLNLLNLAWFKYATFLAETISAVFSGFGVDLKLPEPVEWLPLGISFFTFQIIAYLIDVGRGQIRAERDFLVFGVFKCFYAQLIAGPIVRASELIPQLKTQQRFDGGKFQLGIYFILAGLAIKICIADTLAQFVDHGFSDPSKLGLVNAWATLYAFAFQILSDFWGYSTIAIGIGLMYGIRLPLNFNLPYLAGSFREFWRRWHITLSEWFRDYLYIPLGGNKTSISRNLFLTMVLAGLWHGASWNYVIWGAGHGIWLILERLTPPVFPKTRFFRGLKIVLVFHGVCLLWVLFRAPDLATSMSYFEALFLPSAEALKLPPEQLQLGLGGFLVLSALFGKSLTDSRFLAWSTTRQVSVCVLFVFLILAYADARLDFIYFVF